MRLVLCVVALGLLSVARAQTTQDVKNKDVPEFLRQLGDTRKTIADGYVRWTEAVKAKDVDALVGLYTDDAMVLPEEGEPVSGKNAVRSFYGDWVAKSDKLLEEKFEDINLWQTGNLIVDCTKYSGTLIKDGKELPFRGKRLVVWTREFKGPWRILRDTWNMSPAQ